MADRIIRSEDIPRYINLIGGVSFVVSLISDVITVRYSLWGFIELDWPVLVKWIGVYLYLITVPFTFPMKRLELKWKFIMAWAAICLLSWFLYMDMRNPALAIDLDPVKAAGCLAIIWFVGAAIVLGTSWLARKPEIADAIKASAVWGARIGAIGWVCLNAAVIACAYMVSPTPLIEGPVYMIIIVIAFAIIVSAIGAALIGAIIGGGIGAIIYAVKVASKAAINFMCR